MALNKLICFLLLLLDSGKPNFGSTLSDVSRLYTKMVMDYNKKIRPGNDQSVASQINVSFNLGAIQEFDEVNGKYAVIGFFQITWYDSRMTWNPLDYNDTNTMLFLQDDIWKPTLVITNPFSKIEKIGKDFMTVRYSSNGFAYWTPGEILISSCSVDITYFPFDEQICTIRLMAWGTSSNEIVLLSSSDINMNYYLEHGSWKINSASAKSIVDGSIGSSFIDMSISMKRRPGFYVVNIVLPVIFLMLLNACVFVLPPNSGERVSYAITVLLAIAVFLTLIGDNLPKTSEPMSLLSYFLMFGLVFSSLICFCTILCHRLQLKDKNRHIPSFLKRLVLCCRPDKPRTEREWSIILNNTSNRQNSNVNGNESLTTNDRNDVSWNDICLTLNTIFLWVSFGGISVSALLFFVFVTKSI
ncbi:neuronal acetylcholine receptor subunit alpha-6-like [Mytilus californianus]|uniref:neuronal acetylcholine receptor subunit alpha-6-like n=1 Tax=Mytilus californianus TaxID=6549 RepID=UPI002245394E|nr:neuronal acetylcholine receptor subunit alpha-6-like [Mytilus californianus]